MSSNQSEEEQLIENAHQKQSVLYRVIKANEKYLIRETCCIGFSILLVLLLILNSVLILLYDDEQ